MQVFTPHRSPFETAKAMFNDKQRYNKQIIECKQILSAINGTTKAWRNHPVVKQYRDHSIWLWYYMECFIKYKDGCNSIPLFHSEYIDPPPFLTVDFCDQHKRRLYTKSPEKYHQFAKYGRSNENWYYVDGELMVYIDGKRILSPNKALK